jgi:Fe-S cluster biogenesis protein NfuA/nitrite reductase/ring-hydroxylating ferredoxin subunit
LSDSVARVEGLLGALETLEDPVARETATEMVQALLEMYGEGLARILERADGEALVQDELVSHLLLLHDLHPLSPEERVGEALESVRPYLESHGGDVELVGVEEGVVKVRLHGSCSGCPSSTMTLKLAIEDAIQKAAPEIERVEAEGVSDPAPSDNGLLQLEVTPAVAGGDWATVGGLPELAGGGTLVKPVAGEEVLFIGIEQSYYAYRPSCPGCEESLAGAKLDLVELTCSGCGHRFDIIRAGRCLDEPELYLEPVPLLVDDSGIVKVALGAAVA